METVRPLPAREPLQSGESLTSVIRRTAAAMGYENVGRIRRLLKEAGDLPTHPDFLLPGPTMDRLGQLFNLPASRLIQGAVHRFAENLVLIGKTDPLAAVCDSKTVLRFFYLAHPPICPRCLIEDEDPFERLAWSLRAVPVCLRHQCYLVSTCPQCGQRLRPTRPSTCNCPCGADVRTWSSIVATPPSLDLFTRIDRWTNGEAAPLPGMRCCANLWWFERLASAAARTLDWLAKMTQQFEIPKVAEEAAPWLAAAEMLVNWPQAFYEFLEAFQQVAKHRTSDTGVTRSFGLLLREAKHLEDMGYVAPADALRAYLLDRYTEGRLSAKVCLFDSPSHARLLRQRPWITFTEADELLGLRSGASADLVQRGILEGRLRLAGGRRRRIGVVARSSARQLAAELKTAMSAKEAGAVLGIGRSRVFELIKVNLLPRAVRTNGGLRVPRASVDDLLALYRRLPPLKRPTQDWLSAGEATRRFGPCGLTLATLFQLIQEKRVNARRTPSSDNFRGLRVSTRDLQAGRSRLIASRARQCGFSLRLRGLVVSAPCLTNAHPDVQRMRDEEVGVSLSRLAKTLFLDWPTKALVLKKWIDMGLLRATRNGRAWLVSPDEVNRFRVEFCLLKEAEQIMQIHGDTLLRWIAEGELAAVYGPRTAVGGGFYLLRRADVIRLHDFISAHHRKWRAYKSAA